MARATRGRSDEITPAKAFALAKTVFLLTTDYSQDQFKSFMDGTLGIPGDDERREENERPIADVVVIRRSVCPTSRC